MTQDDLPEAVQKLGTLTIAVLRSQAIIMACIGGAIRDPVSQEILKDEAERLARILDSAMETAKQKKEQANVQ